MDEHNYTDNDNLFPVRKQKSASLTQDEIADILRWADAHSLSGKERLKLLLLLKDKKRAAYTKKRK